MSLIAQYVDHDRPAMSLESMIEHIAVESGVIANMLETFKKVVPSFMLQLRDTNSHLAETAKTNDEINIKLNGKERKTLERAKHLNFITFGERIISAPENFKGDFIQYAILLNNIATVAYQTQNTILSEYNHILSSFITNKEEKISLKDHTVFFNRIKQEREAFAKELGQFLNPKVGTTKVKFREVLGRMADLEPLLKETAKLTSQHSRAKLQDINNSVNQSVDLLNIIVSGVQDGSITNVSPNATMNISRGAYEVAKYVEFVGVIYFDITVFLNCVVGMMDSIMLGHVDP